jgi:hypothetical protein
VPQQNTTHAAAQAPDTFVDLTPADLAAIVAHLQHLDDTDFRLRFGSRARDTASNQMLVGALFKAAHVFGLWDAERQRLLVLGCYAKSATTPDSVEIGLSALPEARGGASQRVANWLQARFVAQGFKRIEIVFYASNQPVAELASRMGMDVRCRQGECVAWLDLKPTADAIRDWLDRLDHLLEAVRNAPPAGATAKL